MREGLFVIVSVFIPLVFGLVPAFLPSRVPIILRWLLWLTLVVVAGWYVHRLGEFASPYPELALLYLIVSASLSLAVLAAFTFRRRSRAAG